MPPPTQTDFVVTAAAAVVFCLLSLYLWWGRLLATNRAELAELTLKLVNESIRKAGVRALGRRAARTASDPPGTSPAPGSPGTASAPVPPGGPRLWMHEPPGGSD